MRAVLVLVALVLLALGALAEQLGASPTPTRRRARETHRGVAERPPSKLPRVR